MAISLMQDYENRPRDSRSYEILGPSAFGPLKFRPVSGDGINGDWQSLVNLVRVPMLKAVHCGPQKAMHAQRR